jgi:hypothetical protein
MKSLEQDREARRKETAEDFTPTWLVKQMLTKLQEYANNAFQDPSKTFCDPACGNGNILVEILIKKIEQGNDPSVALSTLYGCDIKRDNIRECRLRLLKVVSDSGTKITKEHVRTVFNQIVKTRPERYVGGSLGYPFEFPNKVDNIHLEPWLKGIEKEGWLENPSAKTKSLDLADENIEDAQEDDLYNGL